LRKTGFCARSEFLRRLAWRVWLASIGFTLVLFTGVYFQVAGPENHAERLVEPFAVFCGGYAVTIILVILSASKRVHQIRLEEAAKAPPAIAIATRAKPWFFGDFEYRSRAVLLGLPLIHVRTGRTAAGRMQPLSVGSRSATSRCGGLFAGGGLTLAPISLGGGAVGLVALGGAGLGVFSFAARRSVGGPLAAWRRAISYRAVPRSAGSRRAVAQQWRTISRWAEWRRRSTSTTRRRVRSLQQSEFFRWARVLTQNAIILLWLPLGLVIGQLVGQVRKR